MTRAAQQSDAAAQAELALMYLDGEGVQQDSKKAAELYTKAAEQGNTVAQKMLAGMYFGGEGVPQDKKKAAELYRQAAEQGDAEAESDLLYSSDKDDRVPQEIAKTVQWVTKAAEQSYALAQANLARMYINGNKGNVMDNGAGASRFKSRADSMAGGDSAGGSLKQLLARAEQDDVNAQKTLVRMYCNGEDGVPQDWEKAAEWMTKAAEQGDAEAQEGLAVMYLEGGGVPQDKQKAAEWMAKGAEQGDAAAQAGLALMHLDGEGVPEDKERGFEWLTSAASNKQYVDQLLTRQKQGEGEAQRILALLQCIEKGTTTASDGDTYELSAGERAWSPPVQPEEPIPIGPWLASIHPALERYAEPLRLYGYDDTRLVLDATDEDLELDMAELHMKRAHSRSFFKAVAELRKNEGEARAAARADSESSAMKAYEAI
eukprot:g1159.t1